MSLAWRIANAFTAKLNVNRMTILVWSFENNGQTWYRSTVLNTENDTLFLSGVNTDQEAVAEKAKAWCNENGFPFNVKTEAH